MRTLLEDIWDHIGIFFEKFASVAPLAIIGFLVTLMFLWITGMIRRKITSYLTGKSEDPLMINFLSNVMRMGNIIIAFLIFLCIIGKQGIIASILGAGAVSAFVIGFAFKDIGENFLAGVIMAFNRPFRIGDTVMIKDIEGTIMDLSLRETHIKTFDGKDVYIPNGLIIKNPLFNYTIDGFMRQEFTFGLDYGTELALARSILLDTTNSIPGVLQEDRLAKTLIREAAAAKVIVVVQYWINTNDTQYSSTEIKSQAIRESLSALSARDIKVTSSYEVLMKN